jgi:transcriptional regulator
MYIPPYSKLTSGPALLELMRTNSFATLVISGEQGLEAVHLPLLVEEEDPLVLVGHVARVNPIWHSFKDSARALAMFTGPHGYISPARYHTSPNVPTWNYIAVHASGVPYVIEESGEALSHLKTMIEFFDPELGQTNPEAVEESFLLRLLPGVVVFKMPVDRVDGKQKMSQNKSQLDQETLRRSLGESPDRKLQELSAWVNP